MSQRIRGKECSLQVVVDGDLRGGSFAQVSDFNLTPRTEIIETSFLGEIEDDLDINHRGYDFSFNVHDRDSKVLRLLLDIVARERTRTAHPNVNIVVTFAYRSSAEPAVTIVLESCFMKLDSKSIANGNDYVTNSFSGKCKVVSEV